MDQFPWDENHECRECGVEVRGRNTRCDECVEREDTMVCKIGCTCSVECEEATVLAYAKRRARLRREREAKAAQPERPAEVMP